MIKVLLGSEAELVTEPIFKALSDQADIEVIPSEAESARLLIDFRRIKPDVVVLDVGIGEKELMMLIRRLRRASDTVQIVMVGTLSFGNVRISMIGLVNGAAEFLAIPTKHGAAKDRRDFAGNFLKVIRALGAPSAPKISVDTAPVAQVIQRKFKEPRALLIASSTGGPHAVAEVLSGLTTPFPLPILVTQHMPPSFTKMFADNLNKNTAFFVHEASDGQSIDRGSVYVAPGSHHMKIAQEGTSEFLIALDDGPDINFCKPSADPMIMSAVDVYKGHVLCLVLTGMGHDGRDGCRKAFDEGGRVIAQDEESSVVWGMPGAVTNAGLADEVLPLAAIAGRLNTIVPG